MGIWGLLGIFLARIIDVSCNTVRLLFLVKGQRLIAACIGFFEVMVYMVALSYVLGGGRSLTTVQLIFYCGGFAAGNLVGSWLEERLLNTFILVEVILDDDENAARSIDVVRGMGLGATVIRGLGRSGPKLVVEIFCHRHDVRAVQNLFADHGFVTVSDVKRCNGGWFPKRL
ncbi:MAG: DUF5698 domain-containing protein [Synergistaceae bacterium]|jgi:uncharacterized protein YebE (UPF0316 family)|nr:DUF5698 domain-containing protein [Synergistaceae bacterium]